MLVPIEDMLRSESLIPSKPVKKKTFNMTVESFDNSIKMARQQGYDQAIQFFVESYSAAVCMGLHDKFGFSGEELSQATNIFNEIFDSINRGYLSIDDIKSTLKDEAGTEIRFNKRR